VKIRGEQLKKLAQERQVNPEQLGQAIVRTGLGPRESASAIRNWMQGRDHPRCKKADLDKLANALGVQAKDLATFTSRVNFHRGSSRKAKLLVDLVRGKSVDEAQNLLTFTTKRAALNVKKALMAAVADAEQAQADTTQLVVAEARVDEAGMIKRFQQKDRGRAHPILKRLSHITISVHEREQGGTKGRQ
jgi:large subunit ribosomal protein L22